MSARLPLLVSLLPATAVALWLSIGPLVDGGGPSARAAISPSDSWLLVLPISLGLCGGSVLGTRFTPFPLWKPAWVLGVLSLWVLRGWGTPAGLALLAAGTAFALGTLPPVGVSSPLHRLFHAAIFLTGFFLLLEALHGVLAGAGPVPMLGILFAISAFALLVPSSYLEHCPLPAPRVSTLYRQMAPLAALTITGGGLAGLLAAYSGRFPIVIGRYEPWVYGVGAALASLVLANRLLPFRRLAQVLFLLVGVGLVLLDEHFALWTILLAHDLLRLAFGAGGLLLLMQPWNAEEPILPLPWVLALGFLGVTLGGLLSPAVHGLFQGPHQLAVVLLAITALLWMVGSEFLRRGWQTSSIAEPPQPSMDTTDPIGNPAAVPMEPDPPHAPPAEEHVDVRDVLQTRFPTLTVRERDVIAYLLQGLSSDEIAASLHVSTNTLKTHLRNIYRKTGCPSRSALLVRLLGEGSTGTRPKSPSHL